MTTDLFTRYAQLDPASEPDLQPNWDSVGPVLLATIDGGKTTVTQTTETKHHSTGTPAKRSWRGAWVAAAAFAVVIALGTWVLLAQDPVIDAPPTDNVPAPPFDDASVAAAVWVDYMATYDAAGLHSLIGQEYTGFEWIGPSIAETEERVRFDAAMEGTYELGDCRENSPTSATCLVTADGLYDQLMFGVGRVLALTVRLDDNGYVGSTSIDMHSSRPQPTKALIDDWTIWVNSGNTLPFIELFPDLDSTGQLDKTPEEAAAFLLAEVQRFINETQG